MTRQQSVIKSHSSTLAGVNNAGSVRRNTFITETYDSSTTTSSPFTEESTIGEELPLPSVDIDTSSSHTMMRAFRKRISFGDLPSLSTSKQNSDIPTNTRLNSTDTFTNSKKSTGIPVNKNHRDLLADFLYKKWARRRHPMIFFTSLFFVCWIIAVTLQLPKFDMAQSTLPQQPQAIVTSTRSLTAPLIRGTTVHTIPLPLPKEKISVVLMNYSRPRMIRESTMMRTLLSHPNIDEVLLLHSNPKTAFEFVHPKVKNIDATGHNNEMGLSLRFYFCQLAENDWILHLDDDMEFTTEALNELIIEYSRNPKRIVGRFGRDMTPGNSFNGYNSKSRHKSTEVILTKLMLMERDMCSAFFDYAHLVWNDIVLHNGEGPLWNGEDIFMSLVANHVYGRPRDGSKYNNYAMDWLHVWHADDALKDYDNGKYDISGGMRGIRIWDWRWWQTLLKRNRHYSYRGRLWQIARDRLKELGRTVPH